MSERYSCIDGQFPWKVHFEIMKRFCCNERMFIARSYETLVTELFYIGFLAMGYHWSRITKYTRLQEPNFAFSDEAAVPRLDTLTTKFGKSTLVQCQ